MNSDPITAFEIAGLPGAGKTTVLAELRGLTSFPSFFIHDNRSVLAETRAPFLSRASWKIRSAFQLCRCCFFAKESKLAALWKWRKEVVRLVNKLSYRVMRMREAALNGLPLVMADSGTVQPLLESCCRIDDAGFAGLATAMLGFLPAPRALFIVSVNGKTALDRYQRREGRFFEGMGSGEAEAAFRRGESFLQSARAHLERRGCVLKELDGRWDARLLAETVGREIAAISRGREETGGHLKTAD